ncbi:unannotated protein [freshwater metagenome]|uniref:Unannotated protein n=1 Tax=freshwater metagenome TaxID=449393 RepID=A0A6J6IWE7_9ZZZZ|nr:hypothetical protein [Actinomycetota bacterium]
MATDPRNALTQLIASFEKHFEAVSSKRGDEDSSVEQAYYQLEDAFLNYEEALSTEHGEFLPFALAEDDQ